MKHVKHICRKLLEIEKGIELEALNHEERKHNIDKRGNQDYTKYLITIPLNTPISFMFFFFVVGFFFVQHLSKYVSTYVKYVFFLVVGLLLLQVYNK